MIKTNCNLYCFKIELLLQTSSSTNHLPELLCLYRPTLSKVFLGVDHYPTPLQHVGVADWKETKAK